jgi:hypothetical protein
VCYRCATPHLNEAILSFEVFKVAGYCFQDFGSVMSERQLTSTDSEFLDRISGNPIHAYKMMKRFAVDWKKLEQDLTEDDWKGKQPKSLKN